ncbi:MULTISPECIES: hypothetical protein [unclassified Fusibacter]|uniref:hypothetical protein n=1 Tax=unclassified Fusibacter TaxID=2624464 RepID=UPI001010FC6C|nr:MULTISPECIES: hypothetical protein [unclassified Fusibacter]MCK8060428.1 hypothetical protein [Fusibacter sp. A2]NPE20283.1 hypothetical protein [Fusibacter sp. A1]RXV63489.1 hypothetical protein DWB64_00525 [Fusibacter sp. A1]
MKIPNIFLIWSVSTIIIVLTLVLLVPDTMQFGEFFSAKDVGAAIDDFVKIDELTVSLGGFNAKKMDSEDYQELYLSIFSEDIDFLGGLVEGGVDQNEWTVLDNYFASHFELEEERNKAVIVFLNYHGIVRR